jgi:hypothetical protein
MLEYQNGDPYGNRIKRSIYCHRLFFLGLQISGTRIDTPKIIYLHLGIEPRIYGAIPARFATHAVDAYFHDNTHLAQVFGKDFCLLK